MKARTLLILICGAILAARASVETVLLGILKVPSAEKETIVSVPWLEQAANDQDISVSNLVLTVGLTPGDELMVYTGTSYACWRLDDAKHWVPGTTVTSSKITTAAGVADARLARGNAFILKRTGTNLSNGIYIMGKPTTKSATITMGSGYSLIAPPNTAATDINNLRWSGIVSGDLLIIPAQPDHIVLYWFEMNNRTCWWRWDDGMKAYVNENIMIPAGTGVWFKNSETTNKSVTWENE